MTRPIATTHVSLLLAISATLHFLVDGLCICSLYLLTTPFDMRWIAVVYATYNVLAFLTQPLTGAIADRLTHRHWLLLAAVVLLALAVAATAAATALCPQLSVATGAPPSVMAVATLLGTGNSLFHVWGGKQTAVVTANDMRALGVFVAPGVLGLSVGAVFCSWTLLYALLLAIGLLAVAYLHLDNVADSPPESITAWPVCDRHNADGQGQAWAFVVAAVTVLMAVVLLRSYVGGAFSATLNQRHAAIIVVGIMAMAGKMAGGWLALLVGIGKAMVVAAVCTAVCLCLAPTHEVAALLGVFAINTTMPMTLYLANVVLTGREGLTFGLLAAALIPGYLLL